VRLSVARPEVGPASWLVAVLKPGSGESLRRAHLAADDNLTEEELGTILARLARMDASSKHGPWTRATLTSIEAHPATLAATLAERLGRERLPFKADVRNLKALGLTISLETGYRLSPRGRAVLRRLERDP